MESVRTYSHQTTRFQHNHYTSAGPEHVPHLILSPQVTLPRPVDVFVVDDVARTTPPPTHVFLEKKVALLLNAPASQVVALYIGLRTRTQLDFVDDHPTKKGRALHAPRRFGSVRDGRYTNLFPDVDPERYREHREKVSRHEDGIHRAAHFLTFHGAQLARIVKPLIGPNKHRSFENFLGRLKIFMFGVRTHFLFFGPEFLQFFIVIWTMKKCTKLSYGAAGPSASPESIQGRRALP